MKYYNTPECQFEGVVEDETAYKFGSYTKEESDERYASKETEEKAESAVQQIGNKVDKADFDGFKQETESKNAETREIISGMSASVGAKLNELEAGKANKNSVYTKEETDNKFATNTDVLELIEETDVKKANKSETYSKKEADDKFATSERLRELGEETAQQLADFDSEKADKTALQSLESVVNTKASGAEVTALSQVVEGKADKSLIYYVTPQMFGAVGDGETDDTLAFISAINTKKVVFIPSGNYKISSTLALAEGTHLVGESSKNTTITYTGNAFLFDAVGTHVNPVIIESLKFAGHDNNSFFHTSIGKWGACVKFYNFIVVNFNKTCVELLSTFNSVFKNGHFYSDGVFKIAPFDETVSYSATLSNSIVFENVDFATNKSNYRTPLKFDFNNVLSATFNSCAIQHFAKGLILTNCTEIVLNNCWLEDGWTAYEYTGRNSPIFNSCRFVSVGTNKQVNEHIESFPRSSQESSATLRNLDETNSYDALINTDNYTLKSWGLDTLYNDGSGNYKTDYQFLFSIGTSRLRAYVPFNTHFIEKDTEDYFISLELKNVWNYSPHGILHLKAYCISKWYKEESEEGEQFTPICFSCCDIIYNNRDFYFGNPQVLSATGKRPPEHIPEYVMTNNTALTVRHGADVRRALLWVEYNHVSGSTKDW